MFCVFVSQLALGSIKCLIPHYCNNKNTDLELYSHCRLLDQRDSQRIETRSNEERFVIHGNGEVTETTGVRLKTVVVHLLQMFVTLRGINNMPSTSTILCTFSNSHPTPVAWSPMYREGPQEQVLECFPREFIFVTNIKLTEHVQELMREYHGKIYNSNFTPLRRSFTKFYLNIDIRS